MGIFAKQKILRTGTTHEDSIVSNGVSVGSKRKWTRFMPLVVAMVVLAEIASLNRLDMAKNAAMVDSWVDLFYGSSHLQEGSEGFSKMGSGISAINDGIIATESCEEWLEKEDAVEYSRDFSKVPVLVSGSEKVLSTLLLQIFVAWSFDFSSLLA